MDLEDLQSQSLKMQKNFPLFSQRIVCLSDATSSPKLYHCRMLSRGATAMKIALLFIFLLFPKQLEKLGEKTELLTITDTPIMICPGTPPQVRVKNLLSSFSEFQAESSFSFLIIAG